jgi:hypothetical protein
MQTGARGGSHVVARDGVGLPEADWEVIAMSTTLLLPGHAADLVEGGDTDHDVEF